MTHRVLRTTQFGLFIATAALIFAACEEAVVEPKPPKTAEPRVVKPIEDVSLRLDSPSAIKSIDVAANFDDPDAKKSDRLTFTAKSSDVAIVTVSVSGSKITVTAAAPGSAEVTVTATDKDKLTADDTFNVTVNPAPKPEPTGQAPVAVGTIGNLTLTVGAAPATVDVAGNFNDPDGQALTYSSRSSARAVAAASVSGSTVTVTAVAEGTATVTVTATDEDNLTATQTFSVTVNPALPTNRAPVAQGSVSVPELTAGAAAHQVDVASHFTDPDGDALTFKATSSSESVATVGVNGSTLAITPVDKGTAKITVTATDPSGKTAVLSFSVTVNPAPPPRLTLPHTEVINPGGRALTNEIYTLELGTSSADVFVISTNTTTRLVDPDIVRLDSGPAGRADFSQPRPAASQPVPVPVWFRDLQELPPPRLGGLTERMQHLAQAQSSISYGDRDVFIDLRDSVPFLVPATVRKVIRAGTKTLAVWVADREWSATCVFIGQCLTQEMVDEIATRFLRPGANNDIYDWVTTIFGAPWGPHRYSNLIPPEAANQIHILLLDI